MVGVVFDIALAVFDRHFYPIGNFFVSIIDLTLHAHDVAGFVSC